MTKLESAEEVVRQDGGCSGIACNDCFTFQRNCGDESKAKELALAYILEHEKPKIDEWKDAPDWARYMATEESTLIKMFENKPKVKENCWISETGKWEYVRIPNRSYSLIERPAKKWQPKDDEAVMVWNDGWLYAHVIVFSGVYVMDHIVRFDGRTDLRVSEIGDEVERIK